MTLCDDCFKGVRHEGVPEGQLETIGGVPCYVGTPSGEYDKDAVVLFLTDVFGMSYINNKLLVDSFAQNGLKVVCPDLFGGDPIPGDMLGPDGNRVDVAAWKTRHPLQECRPTIDKVVAALKDTGIVRFGSTSYCFGAPFTFQLACENITKVSVTAHPSALAIPEDLEKYAQTSKAPLLINSCTTDAPFPPDAQAKADEILGGGKFAPGYQREYWDGCSHGFAVRGDLSDPKVKAGKEGAFLKSVEFFKKHL
ncbi:dienelactone hydrolase [Hygrophoropsis aurantiaca]|uniref:Dienelactone hydrolase n=1 Tax=Hygrophoropsis aurantiaca TaxID=72124 RepID=A0ACB8A4T8_9AGAM|nr:dienelactone hydrolase [Hygrophoropsis aurantiaca]